MIKIQTLSSGSAGNITYVASATTAILIDIGLPISTTLKLMEQAHIDPHSITAIVITHEHSDHIKGVADFVTRYNTPIYCYQRATKILKSYIKIPTHHFIDFTQPFTVGDIEINFFPVPHDSHFCLGYTFTSGNTTVGIATDIGQMTEVILAHLSTCHIVVLESNHDVQMLMANPKYPEWLKRRILSNRGHLSNLDCAKTILHLHQHQVGQVILAHLSEKNNHPTLAYQTIKQYLQTQGVVEGRDIFIDVALQSQIGNCYCLE